MEQQSTAENVWCILSYTIQCWYVSNFEAVAGEAMMQIEDADELGAYETTEMRKALIEISEQGSLEQVESVRRLLATMPESHDLDFGTPKFTPRDWRVIDAWIERANDPKRKRLRQPHQQ